MLKKAGIIYTILVEQVRNRSKKTRQHMYELLQLER
jgi:hypothetical protein